MWGVAGTPDPAPPARVDLPGRSELGGLAELQDGLLTRSQALAAGLTTTQLHYRIGAGRRWQRVLPGVYATFTGPLAPRHRLRAALLYAGPDAQLAAATAAGLHGLRYLPETGGLVDVLLPWNRRVRDVGFLRVQRTTRLPRVRWVNGLPLSPCGRAVVDTCRESRSLRDVRALMCEGVQRRLTSIGQYAAEIAAGPVRGSALTRRVLADLRAGCRSAPECELRDLLSRSHLPPAEWNRETAVAGGRRVLVADARWAAARLIVEVDSVEWHGFGPLAEATERRRAALAAAGWTVISVSPWRLREEPALVLSEIGAAHEAGNRGRRP